MSNTTQGQQLSDLRPLRRLITGHDPSTSKAIVHSASDFSWQPYDSDQMAFSVVYTTSQFPADLNNDVDITTHSNLVSPSNNNKLGLVNPSGTVIRCVDFAPGYRCGMHRTQSLDYGIVLEGEIDMVLDSGDIEHMQRGDVAVQRATNHQWVNTSETKWARMMFVLQDCKAVELEGGRRLGEDLGDGLGFLPGSGNS